jgi:nucleotide-binding universal stress UspA family protein
VPLEKDLPNTFMTLLEECWPVPYTHVLVPTDFGVTAAHALHKAIALARQQRAALTMLHVLPGLSSMIAVDVDHVSAEIVTQVLEDCRADALQRLAALVPADIASRVDYLVVNGGTGAAILQTAIRLRVDLLVMGHPQHRGWRRFFCRDLAREVVRQAPCSVLLVAGPTRYELVNVSSRAFYL